MLVFGWAVAARGLPFAIIAWYLLQQQLSNVISIR